MDFQDAIGLAIQVSAQYAGSTGTPSSNEEIVERANAFMTASGAMISGQNDEAEQDLNTPCEPKFTAEYDDTTDPDDAADGIETRRTTLTINTGGFQRIITIEDAVFPS